MPWARHLGDQTVLIRICFTLQLSLQVALLPSDTQDAVSHKLSVTLAASHPGCHSEMTDSMALPHHVELHRQALPTSSTGAGERNSVFTFFLLNFQTLIFFSVAVICTVTSKLKARPRTSKFEGFFDIWSPFWLTRTYSLGPVPYF